MIFDILYKIYNNRKYTTKIFSFLLSVAYVCIRKALGSIKNIEGFLCLFLSCMIFVYNDRKYTSKCLNVFAFEKKD